MGDHLRNCTAMEVKNGAVTSSRATEMEAPSLSPSKRRKVDSQQLNSPENTVSKSPANTRTPATPFSSNASDLTGSLNLNVKVKSFETDLSAFFINAFRKTAKTALSEVSENLKEMESSTVKENKTSPSPVTSQRKPSTAKMPSAEEIEEFFSTAEKKEQKRFAEKYNFDIVRDMPLEGRYQWVRLKP